MFHALCYHDGRMQSLAIEAMESQVSHLEIGEE